MEHTYKDPRICFRFPYGYIFLIHLFYTRLYNIVIFNCMYVLGMLLAMQIRFVGFQHVQSGEHMAAMGVFFLMQVFYFLDWVKYLLDDPKLLHAFLRITVTFTVGLGAIALEVGIVYGYISRWTGQLYSLMDPSYAKYHIPIVSSLSEHHLTAWSSVDQSCILMPDRPCTIKGCRRPSQFTNARDRCRKDPEFIKMNRYDQENMKDDEPLLKFEVNNHALLAGNWSQLCSTCKMDVERR